MFTTFYGIEEFKNGKWELIWGMSRDRLKAERKLEELKDIGREVRFKQPSDYSELKCPKCQRSIANNVSNLTSGQIYTITCPSCGTYIKGRK